MKQTWTLREARERHRPPITQVDLAAAVGVHQTYVSLIEHGLRIPPENLKLRLARAVGLAPSMIRFVRAQPLKQTVRQSRDRAGHTSMTRTGKKVNEATDTTLISGGTVPLVSPPEVA